MFTVPCLVDVFRLRERQKTRSRYMCVCVSRSRTRCWRGGGTRGGRGRCRPRPPAPGTPRRRRPRCVDGMRGWIGWVVCMVLSDDAFVRSRMRACIRAVPVGDALGDDAAEDGADAVGEPEGRQRQPVRRGAPLLCVGRAVGVGSWRFGVKRRGRVWLGLQPWISICPCF